MCDLKCVAVLHLCFFILNQLDTNRSGKISCDEFEKVGKLLQFQANDKQALQGLYKRYDWNRDGSLTIEEFGRQLFNTPAAADPAGPGSKGRTAVAKMREVLNRRAGGMHTIRTVCFQLSSAECTEAYIPCERERRARLCVYSFLPKPLLKDGGARLLWHAGVGRLYILYCIILYHSRDSLGISFGSLTTITRVVSHAWSSTPHSMFSSRRMK